MMRRAIVTVLGLALAGCEETPAPPVVHDAGMDLHDVTHGEDITLDADTPDIMDASEAGDVDAGPRAVTVELGPARTLAPWFLGLNGSAAQDPAWTDAALRAALTALRPGTLRFPAGMASNYWDWQRGWFQAGFGPASAPTPNQLEPFAAAVMAAGATPVIVLNVLTWRGRLATAADEAALLESQHQMLTFVRAFRMPVQFVELGDGLDVDVQGPTGAPAAPCSTRFPTSQDYARTVNPWIVRIHQTFFDAQVAVVATASDAPSPRTATWNAGLFETVRGADAITLHLDVPVRDPAPTPAAVLTQTFTTWGRAGKGALSIARARSMDAWISESGLRDRTLGQTFASTWLQGLVAATLGVLSLHDSTVTRACFTDTVGPPDEAALFARAYPLDGGAPPTTRLGRSAAGVVAGIFGQALTGARAARRLTFLNAPTLPGGSDPALLGVAITDAEGRRQALVLNLADRVISIEVHALTTIPLQYEQTSALSLMTRVTGASGELSVTRGKTAMTLDLRPWSITRLHP